LLPTVSTLSVRDGPGTWLPFRRSCRYQRISPLHRQFQSPLPPSSLGVFTAFSRLSPEALTVNYPGRLRYPLRPVNPANACGSRLTATAGTWLVATYSPLTLREKFFPCSAAKGVYNPKAFFPHAASLGQGFPHCPRFSAAASRRSGARVSVPRSAATLSGHLPVIGLVGHYPTNYLMGRGPFPERSGFSPFPLLFGNFTQTDYRGLARFPGLSPSLG
jgi:hypothetical protein